MPKILEIVITSSISIIATILWQNHQFKRSYRFDYKIKLRNIRLLLRESIQQGELEVEGAIKFIKEINDKNWILPSNFKFPYQAIDILASNVVSDSYYSAYSIILKDVINSQSQYYNLKIISNAVSKNLALRYDIIQKNQELDLQRREDYIKKITTIHKIISSYFHNEQDNETKRKAIINIATNWHRKRLDNTNLKDIHDLLISNILELYRQLDSVKIDELYYLCIEAHQLFNTISQLNSILANNVSELVEHGKSELERLKEFEKFFISNEIKSKYS